MQTKGFAPLWTSQSSLAVKFLRYEPKRDWGRSTVNLHVLFQPRSPDVWVAALVATVGHLSIMLQQVCFEIFGHLDGERALNTWVTFVFCLNFWVSYKFSMWSLIRQREKIKVQLKLAETISQVKPFLKSESNGMASWNWICHRQGCEFSFLARNTTQDSRFFWAAKWSN